MTSDPLGAISTRATPQNEPTSPDQVRNAAGGYVFAINDIARLQRFLMLGTTGGTYYTGEQELTKENAGVVLTFAREATIKLVDVLVEISTAGRAPKVNPTIFALAAACSLGDDAGRRYALDAVPRICRTGTHLFTFARYAEQFRGWGRGLRRAIAEGWYVLPDVEKVAYQAVKYRQRDGWSHRDMLRLAHPVSTDPARRALFNWAANGQVTASQFNGEPRPVGATAEDLPAIVRAFERAQAVTEASDWTALIENTRGLSWEMLPDAALKERRVWEALVDRGMPQTALLRQLPRLTRLGVLKSMDPRTRAVAEQLMDPERLRKGRVHPVNVLIALRTYASGFSAKSGMQWGPVADIVDALDSAFYAAYGAIEPAGKRTLIGLDISSSMGWPQSGLPILCREAAAALAMVTVATEPYCEVVGFSHQLVPLPISKRQRLDDVLRMTDNLPFGGTDASLPMIYAREKGVLVDTFLVITDGETWAGRMHPHQALQQYRETTGIHARLVVLALTSTGFSIANPNDPGMLDIAGFDSAVPTLVTNFSRGDV